MLFEYDGETWEQCRVESDTNNNSFFHAAFGTKQGDPERYKDKIAQIRRNNLLNFLLYYSNKPRPAILRNVLQEYFLSRGWSFEDDIDFKKYMKELEEDRHIVIDELPIVAALENVKIVLFDTNKSMSPQVIEPDLELLQDYPLKCKSTRRTAVVGVVGSEYFKLKSHTEPLLLNKEVQLAPIKYKKAPAPHISGVLYRVNLLNIVLLNGLKNYDDWRLSTNARDADYFDDLIFEWGPNKDAFLLQAKFKRFKRFKRISSRDLLRDERGEFSLLKCYFSYQKIKNKYNVSNVVLCTSATGNKFDWMDPYVNKRALVEKDLLYFDGTTSELYTFTDEIAPLLKAEFMKWTSASEEDIINENNIQDFLRCFQIIASYTDTNLEMEIEKKILQMGISDKYNSTDYARHLNREMMEWYETSSRYLTSSDAKVLLSELRNSKILEHLRSIDVDFKKDALLVAQEKGVLHVVSDVDYILNLQKVTKSLGTDVSRALFCNTNKTFYSQRLMIESLKHPRYSTLVIYPNMPKEYVTELYGVIVHILCHFDNKRVILITDVDDELAGRLKVGYKGIFQRIKDNITYEDFTDESQKQLFEKAIRFYESTVRKFK